MLSASTSGHQPALFLLPSLSASERYVGAWAPLVGGRARAEERDSLLLVLHVLACLGRLDVSLIARLTRSLRTLACLMIRDQHLPLFNRVDRFDFTPCLRKLETLPRSLLFFFCIRYFRFTYMLDGFEYASTLTWTHIFASSDFRDDIARALKTNLIWRFSLPTGACLTWLWLA